MRSINNKRPLSPALAKHGRAKISNSEIAVIHTIRPEVRRESLQIAVPNGWDDVRKLTGKVLVFEGRRFTFTGWNSDSLLCFFHRPIDRETPTATLSK